MDPNAPKNLGLIKQFPFVADILKRRMLPDAPHAKRPYAEMMNMATSVDDLTIRVEKADGDLMFRRAVNVGIGDGSYFIQTGGKRKGQVMRQGEYLFAIDDNGAIVNRVNWPRNEEEQRQVGNVYGWAALWNGRKKASDGKLHYFDPIKDKVKHLVWVTVAAWHMDTKDEGAIDGRFGAFVDRSISVTIYGEPKEGFEALSENSSVYTNLSLDNKTMIRGMIERDHDIITLQGMLHELCISFQDDVYFKGMLKILDDSEYRGASGQFGAVKVLGAEMCGYNRIMLEGSECYITFQVRPESKQMYVLGQQGTLPRIRELVRTVVRMWNEGPEMRAQFKPDKKVSVM
jgi:hypothetical protein